MSWRIGIDIGGTFTDFVLWKGDAGVLEKVLSTPEDRSRAVMDGLELLAAREALSLRALLERVEAVVHGTTIADNTLIEMNGAVTGLLTTAGFRDELELRRGYKEDIWDVRLTPPRPIVPRRRRLTVPERIRHDGSIHTPLDEDAARRAIERLAHQGVASVAICTLFSFVNPVHELRLAELVAEALPDAAISLSHRVLPKAPEFERASTIAVNAYVAPRVTGYLDRLGERLHAAGYRRELLVMQSSGGVMTRGYLRESPVRVLASGPAAGVIGGAHAGRAKGAPDLLCVDMGGTSYDVSVVRGGVAPARPGWNWHHRHLVGLPMVSVETLGAGGGSLCHLHQGVLEVGPASAGADPGPICYGRGGDQPTVTDAILVLGLLSETAEFAGGRFALTRKGVDDAFRTQIADPLGCSVEQAAFDCWRVVNANMTQAVRRITAEKGTDPRDLALLAYGGNGPVFAAIQAEELGIERVLVPRSSPSFSALGALVAAPSIDEERSVLVAAGSADIAALAAHWRALWERARHHLHAAGHGEDALRARFQLNLRYPGQNWSLPVPVHESRGAAAFEFATGDLLAQTVEAFHRAHEAEYGHARRSEEPEITAVRVATWVDVEAPVFAGGHDAPARRPAPAGERSANLGQGFAPTAIYHGADLQPGDVIPAPAIIEESFTTIVVYPGWRARVDATGDRELLRAE